MAVTIELVALSGVQPLTGALYPLGSDTAAVEDIALTERTNSKSCYRGTFAAGPSGIHRVLAFDDDDVLLLSTLVSLSGEDDEVAYCSDDAILLARLAAQVAEGPVAAVPAPPAEYQTTVYGYCYDDDGSLLEGAVVSLSIDQARSTGHGLYSKRPRTATSDANGLVTFTIPRNASLRFQISVGSGAAITFQGVDAAELHLPIVVGEQEEIE